jgi:serine/threonine protein phosphatase PrpC
MATELYLRVAGRTDTGRVRQRNEDAFIAMDLTRGDASTAPRWAGRFEVGRRGALVAVSDGMGGAQCGDVASALVLSSLAQALAASPTSTTTSHAQIATAVQNAHQSVWAEGCARGIEMGATLTAAFVHGSRAYVAEVGDSRAYLIRNGGITQLTHDQSYVQMLLDHGAVDENAAQDLPFRNVILQAMGHQSQIKLALGRLDLRRRDCLLLCSDGLSNAMSDREMGEVILSSSDLQQATDRLVNLANERGGRDNETAVLVGFGGDLPPASRGESIEQTYRILETFDPVH